MIVFNTSNHRTDLRTHLGEFVYTDDVSDQVLADQIRVTCKVYGVTSSDIWVVFEEGKVAFPMNANDFLFMHKLNHSVMMIEIPYTKKSVIRMVLVEGIIRLYCRHAHNQDAVLFANWTAEAWQPTQPHHKWLLHCVTTQLSVWLKESFHALKKNYVPA